MSDKILQLLYKSRFGSFPERVTRIPGAGSDRKYFRLSGEGGSAVGVCGVSVAENESFIRLARFLRAGGIDVPEVYGADESGLYYLQEDLGDKSLFSILSTEEAPVLLEECMRSLAAMQTLPGIEETAAGCNPDFNRQSVMWDLNYFKYCFLKTVAVTFDEEALEKDFNRFADDICRWPEGTAGFMYRDCQSRNVMIKGGKPYWIDFQGARRGPSAYDAASFLWQAKACFSTETRERLLGIYLEEFSRRSGIPREVMEREVYKMVALRGLQVLGAYGFRGLIEKKAHFIESLRFGIANLGTILESGVLNPYPELQRVCREVTGIERFRAREEDGRLTVTVFSFSYKKGYPEDLSGNGGGFMFDCRGLHNPGRYDEYKSLTGRDGPVVDFIERNGDAAEFLEDVLRPVCRTVKKYRERGFTSLQVGFGCTGGRHRSVYCAERCAEKIRKEFPDVRVVLVHREQDIREEFNF